MVASMTAFARQQKEFDWGSLSWEIRSVNHRYLEPALRLPDMLRPIEPRVRETLRRRLGRGKLDCQLRFQTSNDSAQSLGLDRDLLAALTSLGQEVRGVTDNAAPLSVADLLKWPGVLQEPEPDMEAIATSAHELLEATLDDLDAARQREGSELKAIIEKRLKGITRIVNEVRALLPDILARQKSLLEERLSGLREELDPSRIEQEIALLAQKCDVDEELDRLETHVTEVRRVLTLNEPIGRRLDFLMQELNREANTLSSKSVVAETSLNAVELKVLIEQIREQVQNIE